MNLINKYNNMAVQAKASLWYTICNFFQKGVSFIVVPIYIRLISTAEYGDWNVFQSWRDTLIILASLNLYAGVYTKTLVDHKENRDQYTSSMQGLGTLVSLGFLAVYLISHNWCNRVIGLNTPLMLLLILYFIVYPAFSFWGTRQRVEYRYKPMVLVTILISVLTPAISIILLKCTDLRTNALVLGYLLVQCAVGLVFYVYHFAKGKCFYNKEYWTYAAKFNLPLIPHYLSLIVLSQSDRIMIKHYNSESEAGIYGFAYQIASVMLAVLGAVNGSRVPWTYEQLRDKVYDKLKSLSNGLCMMFGAMTLMAALLAPDIIAILGTEEYKLATAVIPIVVLSVYFTFVYDMFCSVEFYYGATGFVMAASVIGALSNIILNALWLPRFGFIAAAYTTLISYILFMFMHFVFMNIVRKKQNINEQVYDIKFTFLFSLLVTVLVFVSILTYKNFVIRYLLIVVLVVLVIVFRKKIIGLMKTIRKRK